MSDIFNSNRFFVVIGNRAVTAPFRLSDMPGSAGRMDIMCRCVAQALFISHGIRRDTSVCLVLKGEPDPPKSILISGDSVRYLAPDERNVGGIIRKALSLSLTNEWIKSTPGVYVARKDIGDILKEIKKDFRILYLREDGIDIRKSRFGEKTAFVLGDHIGLTEKDEKVVLRFADSIVKLSPLSLQADQCIVITHYELDRLKT
jgi:tRNA (pseudouridine54-N1)-methyltransferase